MTMLSQDDILSGTYDTGHSGIWLAPQGMRSRPEAEKAA